MTTTINDAALDTRAPQGGPSTTLWLLRSLLTLHALAAIAQPILAGRYLSGDFDALLVHGGNAGLVMLMAMGAFAAAVLYWLAGRGVGWPAALLAVLFVAEIAQTAVGAQRVLAVHIPLGVGIVAGAVAVAMWSYRPSARRATTRRLVRMQGAPR